MSDEKKHPLPLIDILNEINRIRNNALAKLSLCNSDDIELCENLKGRVDSLNELVYFIAHKAGIKKEGAE